VHIQLKCKDVLRPFHGVIRAQRIWNLKGDSMIDKLDKLEERINHFFTKGKNANERCFDFFLRSLTFFIILLFVLLYGTLANADESYTTLGAEGLSTEVFVSSELEEWLAEQNLTTSDLTTVGIASGLQSYPFTISDLANLKIPSSITYNDITYTPEQYNIFLTRGNVSDGGVDYLTCYCVVGENLVVGNGGLTVYNFESSGIGIFACAINPRNLNSLWSGNPIYTQTQGVNNGSNGFDPSITYQYFNVPTPVYYASNEFYTLLNDSTVDSNVRTDFPYQYYHYPDNVFQLNYHYAINHPVEPEVPTEGPEHHLYFKNVQIGMSAFSTETPLLNSSYIVGVDVDNYVKNNMDKFYVFITYHIHYKDNVEVNTAFNEVQPLAVFYNNAYVKGVNEIFSNSPVTSGLYTNFYSFYQHVKSSDATYFEVMNDVNKNMNSVFPSLTQVKDFMTGVFKVREYNSANTPNVPHLQQFYIDVSVVMSDTPNVSQNVGGVYTQRFDFINGTTSVMKSDGLVNQNPFEGEPSDIPDPFLQNGSANGNGSVVQNNNQTVNINLNNNVSSITGGVSDEDSDNTVDNMKKVFDEFKNGLNVINESSMDSEGNPRGFIALLSHTYEFIPGVNYIAIAIGVIVALAVILFILKVLLF
jgi:hypothetical protein